MIAERLENAFAERISLDGRWKLEIGNQAGEVTVPGAWEAEGYSDVQGPMHYRRTVFVPADWQGARIQIQFGAVSYLAEIFVNGQAVGIHEGLWTAFACDITDAIRPGEDNTIEVSVIKAGDDSDRFPYRETLVGFIPYVSSTFGGLWQSVALIAFREAAFTDVRVQTEWSSGTVHISARVVGGIPDGVVTARLYLPDETQPCVSVKLSSEEGIAGTLIIPAEMRHAWSPEHPSRYRLVVETEGAQIERQIGLRQLTHHGEHLLFNERPFHLRGVLSWGWTPEARAPLFSDDEIRACFRQVRELGCNLFKLCLFVPPPRLFEIADEEGMLLWLELPMWYQRFTPHFRAQVQLEYTGILAQVAHHPSIVLVSLGCELGEAMADTALIAEMDALARTHIHDALICDNSGSGEAYGGQFGDFADFVDYHFYSELHNFAPLCDHFQRDWRPARPWIFGEFCDNDDYRDPVLLRDADGKRPSWRDLLGKDGGIHRWAYRDQEARMSAIRADGDFPFTDADLQATSRAGSFVVRKLILEHTRSRGNIGGYVITGLRDTPMSTSGLFDDHNLPKFDPDAFRSFNAENVLVLERGRARVWQNGGDRPARLDRFNHRAGTRIRFVTVLANTTAIHAHRLTWRLTSADTVIDEGQLTIESLYNAGGLQEVATFEVMMPQSTVAVMGTLEVTLWHADGRIDNRWSQFWYPEPDWSDVHFDKALGFAPVIAATSTGDAPVRITSHWTSELAQWVKQGGRAVVLQPDAGILPTHTLPFWRESVKLLYPHPALEGFPHSGSADMQCYSVANDRVFDRATLRPVLESMLGERVVLTPVIGRLDARLFTVNDYVVEAKPGAGRVVFSALRHADGRGDQAESFASNSAGQHLLNCLVRWLYQAQA